MQYEKEPQRTEVSREFGSERDVEIITGRRVKTLQKDRLFGRGFPYYRVCGQIRYDLTEIRRLVRDGRVEPGTDRTVRA